MSFFKRTRTSVKTENAQKDEDEAPKPHDFTLYQSVPRTSIRNLITKGFGRTDISDSGPPPVVPESLSEAESEFEPPKKKRRLWCKGLAKKGAAATKGKPAIQIIRKEPVSGKVVIRREEKPDREEDVQESADGELMDMDIDSDPSPPEASNPTTTALPSNGKNKRKASPYVDLPRSPNKRQKREATPMEGSQMSQPYDSDSSELSDLTPSERTPSEGIPSRRSSLTPYPSDMGYPGPEVLLGVNTSEIQADDSVRELPVPVDIHTEPELVPTGKSERLFVPAQFGTESMEMTNRHMEMSASTPTASADAPAVPRKRRARKVKGADREVVSLDDSTSSAHFEAKGRRKSQLPERFKDSLKFGSDDERLSTPPPEIEKKKRPKKKRTEKSMSKEGIKRLSEPPTAAPPAKRRRTRKSPRPAISEQPAVVRDYQRSTCNSLPRPFDDMRCKACISKITGQPCRFRGLRAFDYDDDTPVGGPFFISSDNKEVMEWEELNVPMEKEHVHEVKLAAAKGLLPDLHRELDHAILPGVITRDRETSVRATCDACSTSIFSMTWLCTICAYEYCTDCYETMKSLPNMQTHAEHVDRGLLRLKDFPKGANLLLNCRTLGGSLHFPTSEYFIPVTRFKLEELRTTIKEMEDIVNQDSLTSPGSTASEPPALFADSLCSSLDSSPSAEMVPTDPWPIEPPSSIPDDLSISASVITEAHGGFAHLDKTPIVEPGNFIPPTDPSGVDSWPFDSFHHTELSEVEFRKLWAKGQPLVITGLSSKAELPWSPEYFAETYAGEPCEVVNCETEKVRLATVDVFFGGFTAPGGKPEKVKDWPPKADFKAKFPAEYKDFSNVVPFGNYTRRDGILNLAAHFPRNAIAPDIGPKMYNAKASSELSGGHGSTRLHMDMANAVNILFFTAPREDGGEGLAAWDIFRAEDADHIRQFLAEKFPDDQIIKNKYDPIHSQVYYLDAELRAELYIRKGVKSWRIYQRAGEGVFIPAGCAHQVCNLSPAIKVAVDFVSPENIDRCTKLTQEFRSQNKFSIWKEDVLALRTMMWFAWVSCSRIERQWMNSEEENLPS